MHCFLIVPELHKTFADQTTKLPFYLSLLMEKSVVDETGVERQSRAGDIFITTTQAMTPWKKGCEEKRFTDFGMGTETE